MASIVGRKADADAGAVDLSMRLREGVAGLDARPERVDLALAVEAADAGQGDFERRKADMAQRVGQVVGLRAVDFAHEAKGEMQLVVILPARPGDAMHQAEQSDADGGRELRRG